MNFGDKLTNLRKQKGLSQEELGEALDVTRQTISKWELGQTTPEMDKLVELSKYFGVGVDELLSAKNKSKNVKDNFKLIIIIIIALVVLIIGIFLIKQKQKQDAMDVINSTFDTTKEIMGSSFEQSNKVNDQVNDVLDFAKDMLNTQLKEQEEQSNMDFQIDIENKIEQVEDILNATNNITIKKELTEQLEKYFGTQSGANVKALLDIVIFNNSKYPESLISVSNLNSIEDISNFKQGINISNNYDISFDYDNSKNIVNVNIK